MQASDNPFYVGGLADFELIELIQNALFIVPPSTRNAAPVVADAGR
jgi:hypothetical protein